jgi:hypothetical protein
MVAAGYGSSEHPGLEHELDTVFTTIRTPWY